MGRRGQRCLTHSGDVSSKRAPRQDVHPELYFETLCLRYELTEYLRRKHVGAVLPLARCIWGIFGLLGLCLWNHDISVH